MKNITVAVPADVYRSARIRAAERGTSVSALVSEYLRALSQQGADLARRRARWNEVLAEIVLSEDLTDDGDYAGVRVENPFRPASS